MQNALCHDTGLVRLLNASCAHLRALFALACSLSAQQHSYSNLTKEHHVTQTLADLRIRYSGSYLVSAKLLLHPHRKADDQYASTPVPCHLCTDCSTSSVGTSSVDLASIHKILSTVLVSITTKSIVSGGWSGRPRQALVEVAKLGQSGRILA